jgi:hypothetical protein
MSALGRKQTILFFGGEPDRDFAKLEIQTMVSKGCRAFKNGFEG